MLVRISICLIVLFVLVLTPCRAEDIFADLPDELITLRDGRRLPGRYHADQGVLLIAGIGHATIRVSEQMIVKREPLKPKSDASKTPSLVLVDQTKTMRLTQESMVELPRADESLVEKKIIIRYQPPMETSPNAAALALIKEKIADQAERVRYLKRLHTTEMEYGTRLVERVQKLTERYEDARAYFEKHGQAYLGYENSASYQLREAFRLLAIGQSDLALSINKAADSELKTRGAEQVMATLLEEQQRLELRIMQEKDQQQREQANTIER
jgi:hypothetical protein